MIKTKELEKEELKPVEEENYEVIYKSKLLGKDFINLDELKKAEAEYKAELAKKEEAKLARKEEALVVQKAIDNYEAAKVLANDAIATAYKEYKEKVAVAEKALAEVEKTANESLNKFLADHPEGFHYTWKSEDGKVVHHYDYYNHRYDVFDNFNQVSELLKKLWF